MDGNRIKGFINNSLVQIIVILLTIIGTVIGIISYFHNNEPNLEYEIVSRTQIFDATQKISSLTVFFDSLDVQKNNLNISVFTVKVLNNGQHVNPNLYDGGDFGLKIKNGSIIEKPSIVKTATAHIQDRLESHFISYNNDSIYVSIPKIALDKDEYYIIKIGVIHNNDSIPELFCVGKIVGQKQIYIRNMEDQEGIFYKAFNGDWISQIIRLICYGIVLILIVIGLLILTISITDHVEQSHFLKQNKRIMSDIQTNSNIQQTVREDFLKLGKYKLLRFQRILNEISKTDEYNQCILNILPTLLKNKSMITNNSDSGFICDISIENEKEDIEISLSEITELIDRYYIVRNKVGRFNINAKFKKSLDYILDLYNDDIIYSNLSEIE